MCRSAVLTEIPRARAICLVCRPRASRPTTSTSRSVSPAGRSTAGPAGRPRPARRRRRRRPAARPRPPGRAPRPRLAAQRRAVRPRLGHRVVGVGGRQQARGRLERGGDRAAVVAGAVEPLVVRGGDRRQRGQERRLARGPARSGRRAAGPAPTRPASAARGFCQIRAGTATRPTSWTIAARRRPPSSGRRRGRTAGRRAPPAPPRPTSDRPGRATRGRRSRPSPRAPGRSRLPAASVAGPARAASISSQAERARVEREDRRPASSASWVAIAGSNACPARSRMTRAAWSSPPSRRWNAASRATWTMRSGSGISSPASPAGSPLPSQRSVRWTNSRAPTAGSPSRSVSICATSHRAAMWRRWPRSARGSRPAAGARAPARAPSRRASARRMPAIICARLPNMTGVKCVGERALVEQVRGDLGVGGASDVEQQAAVVGLDAVSASTPSRRPGAWRSACCAGRARAGDPCRDRSPGTARRSARRRGPRRGPAWSRPARLDGTPAAARPGRSRWIRPRG